MPLGDMTGPRGEGPMTGRGMGYGAGYKKPGFQNPLNDRKKPLNNNQDVIKEARKRYIERM